MATEAETETNNAELRLIMDAVPIGLLSLDERLVINPHFSNAAAKLLCDDTLSGKPFLDVLGLAAGRGPDHKNSLISSIFSSGRFSRMRTWRRLIRWKNSNAGAATVRAGFGCDIIASTRCRSPIISLSYRGHYRGEAPRQTGGTVSSRKPQLRSTLPKTPTSSGVLSERGILSKQSGGRRTKLDIHEPSSDLVHAIFRGVHTIKGVAGGFGLFTLAEASSILEDLLCPFLTAPFITADAIDKIIGAMIALAAVFSGIVENVKSLLGDDFEKETGVFLRIPLAELKRHMAAIQEMTAKEPLDFGSIEEKKEEIMSRLRPLLTIPARKGFARAVKIVPGLVQRLGKNAHFTFNGQDTLVDCEAACELNTPIIHLLRNAFDHGIESPEDVVGKGKNEQASVTLSVERKERHLRISLADDGRGLDPEKLKSVACRKGIITQEEGLLLSKTKAYDLIFLPGFSTADTISDVSGRGVGMDAVLASVKKNLKGEFCIESEIDKGTTFTISIPA